MAGKTKREIHRIGGYLKEVVSLFDESGNLIQKVVSPLMVEFKSRDFLQVIIGASLLAVPVALTEETWKLAQTLPWANVLTLAFVGLIFISAYVYFNFYRADFYEHRFEFMKRVLAIGILSHVVVALLMTVIQQCPWETDPTLAMKRVILAAFPASMGAALADNTK